MGYLIFLGVCIVVLLVTAGICLLLRNVYGADADIFGGYVVAGIVVAAIAIITPLSSVYHLPEKTAGLEFTYDGAIIHDSEKMGPGYVWYTPWHSYEDRFDMRPMVISAATGSDNHLETFTVTTKDEKAIVIDAKAYVTRSVNQLSEMFMHFRTQANIKRKLLQPAFREAISAILNEKLFADVIQLEKSIFAQGKLAASGLLSKMIEHRMQVIIIRRLTALGIVNPKTAYKVKSVSITNFYQLPEAISPANAQ